MCCNWAYITKPATTFHYYLLIIITHQWLLIRPWIRKSTACERAWRRKMIGKPNCSWSSNFRINGNLRPVLNWIWVSRFRQACVLCLIRGNTCVKHPWMGQTHIRTGLRVLQQLESASCCVRQGRASLACTPVITRLASHNPMTKIYELTAEDNMEK